MALTLIKEDGTGKVDANSYANPADGDAYHDGHLYATAWTAAATAEKEKALVMATRLIESQYQFSGFRAHETQALQWPREQCPDPDKPSAISSVLFPLTNNFVESNIVPRALVDSTCEMARELLILDRTAAPPGEGIDYFWDATARTRYSKKDTRPIISHVARAMLSKYGSLLSERASTVRLLRT